MRKLLALLCLVGSAFATSPISGNLKDSATNAVSAGAFVRVFLRGASSCQPRVNGTALIPPRGSSTYYVDFAPDANGLISGTLYSTRDAAGTGDGEIQCGASKQAVWYGLQPYFNGIPGVETPVHAKNGVTLDFTNVTPITTTPTTTAPSGDTTYCRLDGGNCGFTGPITTTSSIQLSGGTSDTTAGAGKLYYRTDLFRLRWHDGTAWRSLIGADSTDTLTNKTLTSPTTTGTDSGAETLTNKVIDASSNTLAHLLQSTASTTASGNVTLTANTTTTVLTQAVTMPSAGGPWRALVTYLTNITATNTGTVSCWVSDATNTFAGTQEGYNTAGAVGGANGSQVSTVTYANGAAVTFTLTCRANATMQATQTSANTGGQSTTMSVSVISAN